jgi:phosphate transport system substrate-binding protein
MKQAKSTILVLFWVCVIFLGVASLTPPARGQGMIQVKGSDSEVNLVQKLSEVFMKKHPTVNISVTGGGSGTGIAALINRKTDIANSSRELSPKEEEAAKAAGVIPFRVVFATDAVSVIVHPSNPVSRLTMDQLGKVFKGEVTNWKQVGGKDVKVSLYGRQSNSGTFTFFREHVLKADYSPHVKAMNGNAQIAEGIKRDVAGIGYVAVGYVVNDRGDAQPGLRIVNVARDGQSEAFSPAKMENVMSGAYPITRPLNQYTQGKPSGNLFDFMKFQVGPEGQEIVRKDGFFPVQKAWVDFNRKQGL